MSDPRLIRMHDLLAALGGREAVRARLSLSKASMKAAVINRVFPPAWFGPMADMAAAIDPPPPLPADLFGASLEKAWPPREIVVAAARSEAA
jgi:hypothetical protein